MKKLLTAYAVVLTAAVSTSCGVLRDYGPDIAKEHKNFWDYTFGGDYTIERTAKETVNEDSPYEQNYSTWKIIYTDKNGTERIEDEFNIAGYKDNKDKYYDSEEKYSYGNVWTFVTREMGNIAKDELFDKVVPERLSEYDPDALFIQGDGYRVTASFYDPLDVFDDEQFAIIKNDLAPETGFKLSECDLKSVAQNDQFTLLFTVRLDYGIDPAPFIDDIKTFESNYISYTEAPASYFIRLSQYESEEENKRVTLYDKFVIMGEEIDSASNDSDDTNESMGGIILRKILEKYS